MAHASILSRATVQQWADDDDQWAQQWLRYYPTAQFFGYDDGSVQCWFRTRKQANAWKREMDADDAMRETDKRIRAMQAPVVARVRE
jgi:hypothetical protein